jgi:DNA-binding NarL/FixJ family response regulator
MDLLMPGMNGVEATRAIRAAYPDVEVVALTSVLEDRMVVDAVEAGAAGYLLKETRPDELFEAVRAAARGEVRLDPRAQQRLMRELRRPAARAGARGADRARDRGAAAARPRRHQQGDRAGARRRRGDRQEPRLEPCSPSSA